MPYDSICISSGHGKYVRGASGSPVPPMLDEVNEARRVVNKVAELLNNSGVDVRVFHDDVSTTQSENLNRIVNWHNSQSSHELDVSVHFNAFDTSAHGTEVLYLTQPELAEELADAIAAAGPFTNRGPKKRTDLAFLNGTEAPAVLIETCFCDNRGDSETYTKNFDLICDAIAEVLSGEESERPPIELPPPSIEQPPPGYNTEYTGTCSWFGGPEDTGVSPSEGLAFIYDVMDKPELFLPYQPEGTTGLARRLNPHVHYFAMRFDYDVYSKTELLNLTALVINPRTGVALTAMPADWGPHEEQTGRLVDLSKGLLDDLELETDDQCVVIFPYQAPYLDEAV
jgi:N-acetylmuramoyl-L-alanine amidase